MHKTCFTTTALLAFAGMSHAAIVVDGVGIPSEGLTLRATQDAPTQFGNSSGTQASTGGSELNQLYADINGGTLEIGITGNLEGNFNKLWLFFDAVGGGEANLAGDNQDGGFGEINGLAGLGFGGATMDHALRFEAGGGFLGVRFADLIDNVGGDIFTAGGTGSLPLSGAAGANGVTLGWDNSNTLGVDDVSAANAATATTGWELSIDLEDFFGEFQGTLNMTAFITNDNGGFASNQFLPGLGASAGNVGGVSAFTAGVVTLTGAPIPIPEPASVALLAAGGLLLAGRRRRA